MDYNFLDTCINRLFTYCKGGNLNIYIWATSSATQGKSGSIYNLVNS